jgi:hypothetical protein
MMNLSKYRLVKIDKIDKINSGNPKMVYDLTVSDNHSYTVNGKIVHNCLTTEQTGIGYPMGSLVKECYEASKKLPKNSRAKIVADGGMKKYSDVIKALAIGADYVMIGSIFNKSLESCGQNYWRGVPVGDKLGKFLYNKGFSIKKKFRGMSTKEVQKKWGNKILKTSEGVVRYRKVEYKIESWVVNFEHYLKSAMSYTNSINLNEFIGKVNYNKITNNSFKRFNK